MLDADRVIELLGLEPLPEEGGMWSQTWRTEQGSAIFYLLRRGTVSALHRLDGDEIYHFYAGDPASMLLLHPSGRIEQPILGTDLEQGHRPQLVVPAGVWQGSETTGDWTLLGTTMAPPFRWEGFELGDRYRLLAAYPEAAERIHRLTRA